MLVKLKGIVAKISTAFIFFIFIILKFLIVANNSTIEVPFKSDHVTSVRHGIITRHKDFPNSPNKAWHSMFTVGAALVKQESLESHCYTLRTTPAFSLLPLPEVHDIRCVAKYQKFHINFPSSSV